MTITQIQDKIKGPAYDFLRGEPDLKHCIYLTLSGSYGYGTNVATSDIDLRGVLVEHPRYLYGLGEFEQFEDRASDTVIYGLKKFVSLCAAANPNTLELLGTDEDCVILTTEAGQLLRDNLDLFLSQKVINSFGNYATAQLRRLANALCRDHYEEAEQERHLANALNAQMEHFHNTHQYFPEGSIQIRLAEGGGLADDVSAGGESAGGADAPPAGIAGADTALADDESANMPQLLMNIHLTDYPVRDFVSIYSQIQNTLKAYNKLNHRNRKKDDPHLYKHAMHLIRLLITGQDILTGKGLQTKRVAEHELLMDIRAGHYTFDEIFALTETYQAAFAAAASATTLPKAPDLDKIEQLMMQIYGLYDYHSPV